MPIAWLNLNKDCRRLNAIYQEGKIYQGYYKVLLLLWIRGHKEELKFRLNNKKPSHIIFQTVGYNPLTDCDDNQAGHSQPLS